MSPKSSLSGAILSSLSSSTSDTAEADSSGIGEREGVPGCSSCSIAAKRSGLSESLCHSLSTHTRLIYRDSASWSSRSGSGSNFGLWCSHVYVASCAVLRSGTVECSDALTLLPALCNLRTSAGEKKSCWSDRVRCARPRLQPRLRSCHTQAQQSKPSKLTAVCAATHWMPAHCSQTNTPKELITYVGDPLCSGQRDAMVKRVRPYA